MEQTGRVLFQTINVWSQVVGADALGLAQYEYALGVACEHNQKLINAEQAFRSSLTILDRNGLSDSPAFARVNAALGGNLELQGQSEQAEKLLVSAIQGLASLGPYDHWYLDARRSYARILREAGNAAARDSPEGLPIDLDYKEPDTYPVVISRHEPQMTEAGRRKRISGEVMLALRSMSPGVPGKCMLSSPWGWVWMRTLLLR